jgi:predicted ATPase
VYRDMTAYVVLDTPKDGYSISQQIEVLKGLTDFLSAGTFSASTKVAGGES